MKNYSMSRTQYIYLLVTVVLISVIAAFAVGMDNYIHSQYIMLAVKPRIERHLGFTFMELEYDRKDCKGMAPTITEVVPGGQMSAWGFLPGDVPYTSWSHQSPSMFISLMDDLLSPDCPYYNEKGTITIHVLTYDSICSSERVERRIVIHRPPRGTPNQAIQRTRGWLLSGSLGLCYTASVARVR
jgi:hypothetical protein